MNVTYCYFCDGSGEGLAPDSICFNCKGRGVEAEKVEADREWDETC